MDLNIQLGIVSEARLAAGVDWVALWVGESSERLARNGATVFGQEGKD